MSAIQTSKKLSDLLTILEKTPVDEISIQHIEEIRKVGDERLIKPIINILISTTDELIYKEISSILFDLKNQKCISPILDSLNNSKTIKHRPIIVSSLWQSGLPCEEYLESLVDIALKNDYLTCIEILTIIENMHGEIKDESIIRSLDKLNAFLKISKEDKNNLLIEIKTILETFLIK